METATAINATTTMAITRIVDMPHGYPLQPKVTRVMEQHLVDQPGIEVLLGDARAAAKGEAQA